MLDSIWIALRFVILPLAVIILLVNLTPLGLLDDYGSIARRLVLRNSEKSVCKES